MRRKICKQISKILTTLLYELHVDLEYKLLESHKVFGLIHFELIKEMDKADRVQLSHESAPVNL